MLDYVTLKLIWWGIFGFLIVAFAVTGGMDVGVNFLLPIVGKNDEERRLILNATGPTWEGNQVWLITLGAGLFAIWPLAYATIFSSMYLAFVLVLIMLILRPPGIDYRGKIDSQRWRNAWDGALFTSGVVLALCFGVVIGNLFVGLPFSFDVDLHEIYAGTFWSMFSPCALIFGVVNLCMMGLQGALFLQYKLPNGPAQRAKNVALVLGLGFIISGVIAGIYVSKWIPGYTIVKSPDLNTSFSVTAKIVQAVQSGWSGNYIRYPLLWVFPIGALVATCSALGLSRFNCAATALFVNSVGIAAAASAVGCALYPFILPSTANPSHSLTIWDVPSSALTLEWALLAIIVLLPIVLLYTAWVYRVMRGKVAIRPESY